jgi:hypothetical protein
VVEYRLIRETVPARNVSVKVIQGSTTKTVATDRLVGHFEIDGLVTGPATLVAGFGSCIEIKGLFLVPGRNTAGLILPCSPPGF